MKKTLCILVVVCLLFGLTSCKVDGYDTKKFKSEEQLKTHLQGLWRHEAVYDYDNEYLSFDNGKVIDFKPYISLKFDNIVSEEGYEKFKSMSAEDLAKTIEAKIEAELQEDYTAFAMEPKKGKLTIENREFYGDYYVLDDCIVCNGDRYEKISDDTTLRANDLQEMIKTELEDYLPSRSLFILSVEEYAQAIKKLHPEIENYILASEDADTDTVIYTNTGRTGEGNYSGVWLYTENKTFMFSDSSLRGQKYRVTLMDSVVDGESKLIMATGNYTNLENQARDALAYFNGYPGALTEEELLDLFKQNAKSEYGGKTFEHTGHGINYRITVTKTNETVVRIAY